MNFGVLLYHQSENIKILKLESQICGLERYISNIRKYSKILIFMKLKIYS